MKKITLLTTLMLVMMFGISSIVTAQNLALNPGFESWTVNGAVGPADDWGLSGTSMTGAQETTNVRTGASSTNITWTTSSTRYLEQYVAITGGSNYNFSFWALDNDPGGRARVAIRWYDNGGSLTGSAYYGGYTSDDASWQQLTSGSQAAPADAVEAHIEIRVYDVSGWSGTATVYVDDAEFEEITTLEISKAYAVSETAVDVLYSAAVTAVAPGDYSLTGSAAITFTGATIDATNTSLVHLTGASTNMASDITLDNIVDAANADNFDFYAGIISNAFVNTTNPGGTMANGELATFVGIVSANDAYNNVWFSDAAGAYNGVLIYSSSFDALVAVGDEILFSAKRTVYNGLSELEYPELISINSSANTPYGPDVIPGSAIDLSIAIDTDPAEKWEGQFVKIENVTVDSYVDYEYTCSWSDGTNTYNFIIGDNVDYHLNNIALNVGETYTSVSGVVDWLNAGPYYRINPREQSDIVSGGSSTAARIVGSMNTWSTTDPDYVMTLNANGLYELTKSLDAGDHEYKVLEGDDWSDPSFPANNEHAILTATEDITWKANITTDLVMHTLPVMAGDFMSTIGGNDWDPTELMGEMTDPEGDETYTLELTIPAGDYEAKVTLNNSWVQSTSGNIPFSTDGFTPTTFTYDFLTNTTTISGPAPPTATVTFIVDDALNMMYDGFFLKGSWDVSGLYDPSWGGGIEHSQFYDDGTNGDVVAGDHIWTCQQELVVDGGSNTWEWGVNDSESFWIVGNWQFTVTTEDAQTLTWVIPAVPGIVINEIMYNSAGADEEWVELYNTTASAIDLENYRVCDNDQTHTNIVIPAGYSIPSLGYFTISIATNGAFPFTPDYDGTGNFAFGNSGDAVRIWNSDNILTDIVDYDDSTPWPSAADGDGPSLSLISPELDNFLAESWKASNQDGGTPGAFNFPIVVTAPNGGEVIETGTTFDITWTIDQYAGDINIELVREGEDPQLIVSNLPSSNLTFNWGVLSGTTPASDYKILISDVTDPAIFDKSDSEFSITEGFVEYDIVITEIMYNPPEVDTDSLEFIEIYNNGTETVNLDGFTFADGVDFTFPNVDVSPDEYVLVGINSDAMFNTFGVTAYQWTSGALSNGGEKIQLNDGGGNVVDSLTYDDHLPWDTLCDGRGPSLTLCNPDVDNSIAENWTHSLNLAAINASGDSIFATPGSGCDVDILAGFEGEPTTVSLGGSVIFTDLSLGDITEWTWTFEGGEPATYSGQTPPEIFYSAEGTFDVTLLVSNGTDTDELTYVDYIEVIDLPAPTNLTAEVGPEDDVQLSWNAPGPGGFTDDFESYEDFVIEFTPWVCLDVDGSTTYGMTDFTWPHAYEAQAFIIFNPSTTEPVVEDVVPHSGNKLAASFAATAAPNNDWMISPMVNVENGFNASFFAKSYTDQYGLERFKVGVSTTGLNPEDFTIISEGDYMEAPVEDWTEFVFSLEDYVGQDVYVGIQCVSNDAFIFLVDDFSIGASKSTFAFNTNTAVVGSADRNISYTAVANTIPVAQQIEAVRTDDPLGFNVYRDGNMINAALVEVTQYNDPEPTIGSHDYYVTAVYDAGESGPSNVVSVIVTDINENETGSIRIYPNPANGLFNIELSENLDVEVSIIDLTGKVVYNNNLNKSAQVNVSGFNSGIYFVRILDNTSGKISAHKLIIK